MARLFKVAYQVRQPNTNVNVAGGDPDLYRRDPQEAILIANAGDGPTLGTVLGNNVTLASGEVIDILQVTEDVFGDKPIFQ
jgi:hypothetical protein